MLLTQSRFSNRNTYLSVTDLDPGDGWICTPSIEDTFVGHLVGSLWIRFPTATSPVGTHEIIALRGINPSDAVTLSVGVDGSNDATFEIENDGDTFISPVIFVMGTDTDWLHLHFWVDFATPANSRLLVNGVDEGWSTTPTASTPNYVIEGLDLLSDSSMPPIDLAQIVISVEASYTDSAFEFSERDFLVKYETRAVPRYQNRSGTRAFGRRPQVYIPFSEVGDDTTAIRNESDSTEFLKQSTPTFSIEQNGNVGFDI